MGSLPVDIRITRWIIFGYMFSLLEESIIIAAGLSVKSIFDFPSNNGLAAYSQKLTWSDGSGSDLFAILKSYRVWCSMKGQHNFDEETENAWATRYFVNTRSMKEMHLLVNELKARLNHIGIREMTGIYRVNWLDKERTIVLKVIISGAFYPNYFLRKGSESIESERMAFHTLDGHDPCKTVFFSNFDSKYIGQLYVQCIKNLFEEASIASKNIEVRFEAGSQKVFVTFVSDCDLEYGDGNNLVLSVPGRIEHCDKFWFQPLSEEERLREITYDLNKPWNDLQPFQNPLEISKEMIVAAPFIYGEGPQLYHRARVLNSVDRYRQSVSFRVLFLDYGKHEVLDYKQLRKFGQITSRFKDFPPRVFECCLGEVQPSSINCPNGKWPEEAMSLMQNLADAGTANIEVYSVVNGLTSVILKMGEDTFNNLLIKRGYAQHSDENYMSKADHVVRMRQQKLLYSYDNRCVESINQSYIRSVIAEEDIICEPPPIQKCHIPFKLRGPYSPLESKVYAATCIGASKDVKIESQSVDSVLLDTDPQDNRERLLVAAKIIENTDNNSLTARATTIMPNILGFAPLMGLLFCPTAEIRRDAQKTKYVNILAGLGCDENKNSLFKEHDIEFNLDVAITLNDLNLINKMRFHMDNLIFTMAGEEYPSILTCEEFIPMVLSEIKYSLTQLLNMPRQYIETHYDKKENMWGQIHDVTENFKDRSVFPYHSVLRLCKQTTNRTQTIRDHCANLHNLAENDSGIKSLVCELCCTSFNTVNELRINSLSLLHRDRESQIGFE